MPFRPCSKQATSLDNVVETGGRGHEHRVDVGFAKEGCREGNHGRDEDFSSLAKLALVASIDVPFDVLLESRPPETVEEGVLCGIEAFVSKVVMCFVDEVKTLGGGDVKLMLSMTLPLPKSPFKEKEPCSCPEEPRVSFVVQIWGKL